MPEAMKSLGWETIAKWAVGAATALVAAVVTLGAFVFNQSSAHFAEEFGKWANTVDRVNQTVDRQFTALQRRIAEVAVVRERQFSEISVALARIEGRLDLADERSKRASRRINQLEQEVRNVELRAAPTNPYAGQQRGSP